MEEAVVRLVMKAARGVHDNGGNYVESATGTENSKR
jgi:hypothetical protein